MQASPPPHAPNSSCPAACFYGKLTRWSCCHLGVAWFVCGWLRSAIGCDSRAGVLALEIAMALGVLGLSVCGCFIAAKKGAVMPANVYVLAVGVLFTGQSWCFHATASFCAFSMCVRAGVRVFVRALASNGKSCLAPCSFLACPDKRRGTYAYHVRTPARAPAGTWQPGWSSPRPRNRSACCR